MGDPKDDVDIGPMVSVEAREEVHQQVLKSIEDGANLIIGGEIPKISWSFLPNYIIIKCGTRYCSFR